MVRREVRGRTCLGVQWHAVNDQLFGEQAHSLVFAAHLSRQSHALLHHLTAAEVALGRHGDAGAPRFIC